MNIMAQGHSPMLEMGSQKKVQIKGSAICYHENNNVLTVVPNIDPNKCFLRAKTECF